MAERMPTISPTRNTQAASPESPSKRELALAYAARVPRPRLRDAPQHSPLQSLTRRQTGPPEADLVLDEATVDFQGFAEVVARLEPGKENDEAALRSRFNEFSPSGGLIYVQEYRLSLLLETLSVKSGQVYQILMQWDQNGDAQVDRQEFGEAIRHLGLQFADEDIDVVFHHFDSDGSGSIDFVELDSKLRPKQCKMQVYKLRTSLQLRRGTSKKLRMLGGAGSLDRSPGAPPIAEQLKRLMRDNFMRLLDVYKMFDVNGDGCIEKREFFDSLAGLGYDVARHDSDALFDSFDVDGSGEVSYHELYKKLKRTEGGRNPTRKRGPQRSVTTQLRVQSKQMGNQEARRAPPSFNRDELPAPEDALKSSGGRTMTYEEALVKHESDADGDSPAPPPPLAGRQGAWLAIQAAEKLKGRERLRQGETAAQTNDAD